MRSVHRIVGLLLIVGTGIGSGYVLGVPAQQATSAASAKPAQASGQTFPQDVYAETGNRFPIVKREALDETGRKLYDARTDGFGPGGIRLYSPPVADSMGVVNDYLRRKSGLDPRIVELTILVTARETDCEYVWTAHEPAAQKAGLEQSIIDAVKYRRPLTAVGEKEAAIIQLGRETIGKHKASSETFGRAQKLFGNQGLVNLLSLMGDYASTAILLDAADQHVRPADKPLLPLS
jgi:4-carboxymuconolactone decarboxylase